MKNKQDQEYWTKRYKEESTGWDIGHPSTPLKTYIDQLTYKNSLILVPGAGNGHEVEYLFQKGFRNVYIMDISKIPLKRFHERNPDFTASHLLHEDFFEHQGQYDLILEQTFFCSFVPTKENRNAYFEQMAKLLKPLGKLAGLWFDFPLSDDMEKRPFGGSKECYLKHLEPYFKVHSFTNCYNSIPKREDNELFGVFIKK